MAWSPRLSQKKPASSWPTCCAHAAELASLAKTKAPVWLIHHRPTWAAITGPLGIPVGGNLTLRFDLVRERAGSQPFDAYAIVDLRSNGGASAIAAVRRRCGQ